MFLKQRRTESSCLPNTVKLFNISKLFPFPILTPSFFPDPTLLHRLVLGRDNKLSFKFETTFCPWCWPLDNCQINYVPCNNWNIIDLIDKWNSRLNLIIPPWTLKPILYWVLKCLTCLYGIYPGRAVCLDHSQNHQMSG